MGAVATGRPPTSNPVAALFERAAELDRQGVPYALVTVIRAQAPTSAKAGDKALVLADGTIFGWIGGGCAQPAVIRTVRQALADARPRQVRIEPGPSGEHLLEDIIEFTMSCHSGGTLDLFIDPVVRRPELVVFGQSAVAGALAGLAPRVGFHVSWVAGGPMPEGVPGGGDVQVLERESLASVAPGAFAVVATQGRNDVGALKDALSIAATHVAFVASRRKGDLLKESLRDGGHDPAAVDAIEAPAGEAIGARTPEEIALSVLAALVARRRGRQAPSRPREDPVVAPEPVPAPATASAPATAAEREVRRPVAANPTPGKGSCCGG